METKKTTKWRLAELRDRAVRIVRDLTGADATAAGQALAKSAWKIQEACARLGGVRRRPR